MRWPLDNLRKDLRYAFRSLAKRPGFTAAAVLSLALGIGANTTIFSVVNAAFLAPIPVERPERLAAVYTTDAQHPGFLPISYENFEDLRDQNRVFDDLVAVQWLMVSVTGGDTPERVFCQIVTGSYFDTLGVRAGVGRTFLPEDDSAPGRNPVVVLNHDFWEKRFNADPGLVGRTVLLNNREFTVVGIAPEGFKGTDRLTSVDVWIPMSMYEQISNFRASFRDRSFRMFNMIGRLKPGVTLAQAEADLQRIGRQLEQTYPDNNKGMGVTSVPFNVASLEPNDREKYVRGGTFLMIVVGLLLLIACANLASLLLARASSRESEMAIRLAVGAKRGHLIRQLLVESLVLSLGGGLLGLLVAAWSSRFLWRLRPPFITENTPLALGIDVRVLAFTLLLSLMTGVLFGLAPALQSSRPNLVHSLTAAARTRRPHRKFGLRDLLVVGQISLALIALIAAGLFLNSLRNAQNIDPGFDVDRLLVMSMDMGGQGYNEARGRGFYRQIVEDVKVLPGVVSATISSHRPLSRVGVLLQVVPEGQEDPSSAGTPVRADVVGDNYFETVGIPILRGRGITAADRQGTRRVAVVNETMAKRFWPGQEAIGKRFDVGDGGEPTEIVGIARDAKYVDIGEPPTPYFYVPFAQDYVPTMTLYVRTEGSPAALLPQVRGKVQSLAPTLPLMDVQTVSQRRAGSLWAPRLGAVLLGSYGLLAFILAATGIYGVIAYSVSQRRREIGIRMALGAHRGHVVWLVILQAMGLLVVGLVIGIGGALAGGRLVAGMLFGISSTHLPTIAAVAALFATVALVASFIPANRATRVDATTALRLE